MKICTKCRIKKSSKNFGKNSSTKDRLGVYCKSCRNKMAAAYRKTHREILRLRSIEYRKANKDIIKIRRKRRYKKNPLDYKNHTLKTQYNISYTQYDSILKSQRYLCAICEQPERVVNRNGTVRSLAVDHDHSCCPSSKKSCGKCVRGLLCSRCNMIIGFIESDIKIVNKVKKYLLRNTVSVPRRGRPKGQSLTNNRP